MHLVMCVCYCFFLSYYSALVLPYVLHKPISVKRKIGQLVFVFRARDFFHKPSIYRHYRADFEPGRKGERRRTRVALQKTPSIFPHWLFKWRGPADAWLLLTFRTAVSDAPVLVPTPDICSCSNDAVPLGRRKGTGHMGQGD